MINIANNIRQVEVVGLMDKALPQKNRGETNGANFSALNNKALQVNDNQNKKEVETKAVKKPESSEEKENKVSFKDISQKLSSLLEEEKMSIEFSIDDDTKKMVIKFLDSDTKEVINQLPPEISLKIAKALADTLEPGILTNATI